MLSWLTGTAPAYAAVILPGDEAATPDVSIARLRAKGITNVDVQQLPEGGGRRPWVLRVDDPHWGIATIDPMPEVPDPAITVQFASNLTDADKARVAPPFSALSLQAPARTKRLLADRKQLLRWAAALLGQTGLVVLDWQSHMPWTREALADELAHDADLDIEGLYEIENVYRQEGADRVVTWMHTHGLGAVGAFDIDVVAPHPDFAQRGSVAFRVIAQMALAKKVSTDGGVFQFGKPGAIARLVRARDFMRGADRRWTDLRDAGHDSDGERAVLCDPEAAGVSRFLGRGAEPVPMSFARREIPEGFRSWVPNEFSELASERAKKTIVQVRRYLDEFQRFKPVALVKLGMPTRAGAVKTEHMWFEVHELGDDWVDATLTNQPYEVEMSPGDRGRHSLEMLSDWIVFTPAGQINPRSAHVARFLRELPADWQPPS